MPQMAPMSWFTMFMYFIIMFLMFNTIMYFNFKMSLINKTFSMSSKAIFWKW